MRAIYRTGRGSFKVRAKWAYNKKDNLIEITEIPYTTTIEAIIDKIAELVKNGKVREIADVRDETDLSGLKIAIDLKRGTDPGKADGQADEDDYPAGQLLLQFQRAVAGMPRVLGVSELLDEWTAWRTDAFAAVCSLILTRRRTSCICCSVCAKSCSISTRRLKSSARPKRTQMLSRI